MSKRLSSAKSLRGNETPPLDDNTENYQWCVVLVRERSETRRARASEFCVATHPSPSFLPFFLSFFATQTSHAHCRTLLFPTVCVCVCALVGFAQSSRKTIVTSFLRFSDFPQGKFDPGGLLMHTWTDVCSASPAQQS